MERPNTIYELPYFDSDEEAQAVLQRFANGNPILFLPEYDVIEQVARELTEVVRERRLTPKEILLMYQKLRQSHTHTDIWCMLPDTQDPSGQTTCGGKMDIGVDAFGAFYFCNKEPNIHRIPLP